MRRRPPRGRRELQRSLFERTEPERTVPAAGYGNAVTSRLLELLGPPHALDFDDAWGRIMREMPPPIGWNGTGERGEQSAAEFLRDRLRLAWIDDEAIAFSRDDLASVFDGSAAAAHAGARAQPPRRLA